MSNDTTVQLLDQNVDVSVEQTSVDVNVLDRSISAEVKDEKVEADVRDENITVETESIAETISVEQLGSPVLGYASTLDFQNLFSVNDAGSGEAEISLKDRVVDAEIDNQGRYLFDIGTEYFMYGVGKEGSITQDYSPEPSSPEWFAQGLSGGSASLNDLDVVNGRLEITSPGQGLNGYFQTNLSVGWTATETVNFTIDSLNSGAIRVLGNASFQGDLYGYSPQQGGFLVLSGSSQAIPPSSVPGLSQPSDLVGEEITMEVSRDENDIDVTFKSAVFDTFTISVPRASQPDPFFPGFLQEADQTDRVISFSPATFDQTTVLSQIPDGFIAADYLTRVGDFANTDIESLGNASFDSNQFNTDQTQNQNGNIDVNVSLNEAGFPIGLEVGVNGELNIFDAENSDLQGVEQDVQTTFIDWDDYSNSDWTQVLQNNSALYEITSELAMLRKGEIAIRKTDQSFPGPSENPSGSFEMIFDPEGPDLKTSVSPFQNSNDFWNGNGVHFGYDSANGEFFLETKIDSTTEPFPKFEVAGNTIEWTLVDVTQNTLVVEISEPQSGFQTALQADHDADLASDFEQFGYYMDSDFPEWQVIHEDVLGTNVSREVVSPIENERIKNPEVTYNGKTVSLGGSADLNHSDLSNISSDDHHTRPEPGDGLVDEENNFNVRIPIEDDGTQIIDAYGINFGGNHFDVGGDGDNTVTVSLTHDGFEIAGNQVTLGGATEIDHADLTSINSDDHHVQPDNLDPLTVTNPPSADSSLGVALGDGAETVSTGTDSDGNVAIGLNAKAESGSFSGYANVAIGKNSVAEQDGSIAIGRDATVNNGAFQPVAIGADSEASGTGALAYGSSTTASSASSFALGFNATASAAEATAVGFGANANADKSFALGTNATANGARSVALGPDVTTFNDDVIKISGEGYGFGIVDGGAITDLDLDNNEATFEFDSSTEKLIFKFKDASGNLFKRKWGYKVDSLKHLDVSTSVTTDDEDVIFFDSDAPETITLASKDAVGGNRIKFKDSNFNASNNNLTIDTEGTESIEQSSNYTLDTDGGYVELVYSDAKNAWLITSEG